MAESSRIYAPRRVSRVATRPHGIIFSVIVAVVLIVVSVVASTSVYARTLISNVNERTQTIDSGIDTTRPVMDDGELNLLLLGSDQRPEDKEAGEDGARTDTIMFVHIPDGHEEVYVMSIMRDLWVEIPGYGMGKINGAYEEGGFPLVVDTVEGLVGSDIDHIAIIDFEGFRDVTEALGGVEVDNEQAFSSGIRNPSFFPEGKIKVSGTDALRFVRERHAFNDGDYQRVKNQQLFLEGLVDQLLARDVLTNPGTLSDVITTLSPYLSVDDGLDAETMLNYGLSMSNIRSSDIKMFTIPNAGADITSGGAAIVRQDEAATDRMREALRSGTMDEFLEEYDAEQNPDGSNQPESTSPANPPEPSAVESGVQG
ncbi:MULTISPECIES: LCP family protein [Auritidibacter]|uniref:LCP family protein n=1 Tax=Auritidibacter TaxID=1160973 RepID=UPI000D739840|nr:MULTISPECIES: LCP family protein [Auritidibacter]AXR73300.1 LytR family transcriptional regulator [Auritidibacter sp. NML130574]NIH70930.1 LCP family protein required for cell wall assembly [Auritidibacter ignavus]PXA76144.1 transcriptional regulator [Auritidibacter sp. NML100628]RMX24097.1 LytR family transcriptional regulator [Auritidibacter ignavus]WGH81865.1 LCP family protein [Auritidibacter ignavus]